MRLLASIMLIVAGFFLSSCHYAQVKNEEERIVPVSAFDKVLVKGSFTIMLEQGNEPGLKIRGLKETLETVDVDSDPDSGWLKLTRDKFSLSSPEVVLRFSDLNKIKVEGGATIKTDGYLDLKELEVRVEGGANIKMKMKSNNVGLRGEGGVVFELEGVSSRLAADLSGAAYLKAANFESDTAYVQIEGVGFATLHVNKYLDAHLEGMGKISYSGDPEVNQSVDGLGKIEQN